MLLSRNKSCLVRPAVPRLTLADSMLRRHLVGFDITRTQIKHVYSYTYSSFSPSYAIAPAGIQYFIPDEILSRIYKVILLVLY